MKAPEKRQESSAQKQSDATGRSAQGPWVQARTWEPVEVVDTTSFDSFPASDPPGWAPLHVGVAGPGNVEEQRSRAKK